MIWATILSYASKKILPFLMKHWWKIAIVLLVVLILWKINSYMNEYRDILKKNTELTAENRDLNRQMLEQAELMNKWALSVELSKQSVQADAASEKHYHQEIVKNETVINNYVKNGETEEGLEDVYQFLNSKWMSVDQPYDTDRRPVESQHNNNRADAQEKDNEQK